MLCIGVCDSGVGGREAFGILRRARPDLNLIYLADTAHAPYGTKSLSEVGRLVKNDISLLRAHGANAVLIACMTASGAYTALSAREDGVFTVLQPTALAAARLTQTRRIAVLATECTVRSELLERAVRRAAPDADVRSRSAQRLVALVEAHHTRPDDPIAMDATAAALASFDGFDADVLVLGCTHFSALSDCFRKQSPRLRLISSGAEGAHALLRTLPPPTDRKGSVRFLTT